MVFFPFFYFLYLIHNFLLNCIFSLNFQQWQKWFQQFMRMMLSIEGCSLSILDTRNGDLIIGAGLLPSKKLVRENQFEYILCNLRNIKVFLFGDFLASMMAIGLALTKYSFCLHMPMFISVIAVILQSNWLVR